MPLRFVIIFSIILFFKFNDSFSQQKSVILTEKEKQKNDIKEYIFHHLKDTHDFDILSYKSKVDNKKNYVGFPLPVILWDNGLVVFLSSNLNHGKDVAHIGANYYKLYHNKIYKTDSTGEIIYDDNGNVLNIKPLDFSITKGVLSMFFISTLMILLFRSLANSYKITGGVATGIGRFFEPIVIYIRDEIAIPNIGKKYYKNYMSYLLTIFFFIWFLNLLGLTPLGINVTGNIAVTFSLALLTFLITNLTAKKDYWKHIFWMPGIPVPMKLFLAPIEFLGIFIKPISLMIRLFANISAGHIIILSLISLIFIFKSLWLAPASLFFSVFISLIEVLVVAIQAYIFTMLSALYIGSAIEEHEH